jgi:hypothetical protein
MTDLERNLNDLTTVARRQREIAQKAIADAREIEKHIQEAQDPQTKKVLSDSKERMLDIARELTANSTATTAAVETTIGTIDVIVKTKR